MCSCDLQFECFLSLEPCYLLAEGDAATTWRASTRNSVQRLRLFKGFKISDILKSLQSSSERRVDKMRGFILTACLLASLAVTSTQITPVSNAAFYPYGPGTSDILDDVGDDSSSAEQSLSISFPFFGNSYDSLWVNTNGKISFGERETGLSPITFPAEDKKIIAVYFTDIKTNYSPRSGHIFHRETTDAGILARATTDIQTAFPAEYGGFVATWAYISTFHEVAFFGSSGASRDLRNTFQLVLITDGCRSFALFNYDRIDFLQGSTNGGDGSTGTGPNPAQVEINGGDGIHYTRHPYSRTTDLYDLPTWTDPAVPGPPGRWYRRTDQPMIGDDPGQLCPSGYTMNNNGDKCFKVQTHPLDYSTAMSGCAEDGAEMFNIRTQDANERIIEELSLYQCGTGYGRGFWIGLTDADAEGTFVWEDGTPFDASEYSNWAPGALAANDETRNCVYMDKGYCWQWDIQSCDGKKKSICINDPAAC
ncbi:SNED1 [Branchiostoma lanceolatum]|uniref:SNED1 protein n=1 Tax=Branchiostoma lanceolatum TaxID=7740 RepID=A0A8K0AEI6_BRALA|nr:SNED1 [Branchiostoma lanceolatum]